MKPDKSEVSRRAFIGSVTAAGAAAVHEGGTAPRASADGAHRGIDHGPPLNPTKI